jgi:Predicted membrane protein (DUF2142)
VATAAWTFASPLGSAPDEPAHLIRAASLVRGQLLGKPLPHASKDEQGIMIVRVPEVFASLANDISCFQGLANVTAACQQPLVGSPQDVAVETYVGRYSPFYYVLVGLPTLALVSVKGVYGARLASGALSAAMLALAVVSLRRCRGAPLLGAGVCLAITPMALYLASVVNPSGLEIASAISAWVGAMALASQRPDEVGASSVAAVCAPILVLILVRALSPAWVVFIVAAFATVGPLTTMRALLSKRYVKAWLAICAAAGVASLAWDIAAHPFKVQPGTALPAGSSEAQVFELALDRLHLLVTSTIGQFGWLDTPSPFGVTAVWLAAFGAIVLLSVCVARRRGALAVAGVVLAWLVVPMALVMAEARQHGLLGQGRDFMALAVGAPIVAGFVISERLGDRRATMRLSNLVLALLTICEAVDFYGTLRRYTVGISGPVDPFASVAGAWHPPVPGFILVPVFTVAVVAFALLLRRAVCAQPAS